ncbi:hypothetical protein [Microvirga massiliensis]|uniref:hypothetical protein n=1 Tax=Microvirga massiliensis TaxID=1033741 RepID=UPI000AC87F27|nr:hypothetical protein [Microvirga massiliensis]
MPAFEMLFLKSVTNDIGLSREIRQRAIEVEAQDAAQAILTGQRLFCSLERIADWSLRADRFELALKGSARTPLRSLSSPGESARAGSLCERAHGSAALSRPAPRPSRPGSPRE